jgi:hypothetical protein
MASEAGSTAGYVATAPGFANEKKVDHAAVIIEVSQTSNASKNTNMVVAIHKVIHVVERQGTLA